MCAKIACDAGRMLVVRDERVDAIWEQVDAARRSKATGLLKPVR